MKTKPRIILFDLETLANMERVMHFFPGMSAYPGLTMKATHNSIICVGWKELGAKETNCINAWDYAKRWKRDVNDDYEVVKAFAKVLETADGLITHNGARFDIKFLNSRLVYHGFSPIPKMPHIDTCRVAKSKLFLFNNRLNTVAEYLGCELKMENGGWSLWERVLKRDVKAQQTMEKYCKQDVRTLEQVYLKWRPLITTGPNFNQFSDNDAQACPNCGSSNTQKHGKRMMAKGLVQRHKCNDCGTAYSQPAKIAKAEVL